jgi:hypothetical protein
VGGGGDDALALKSDWSLGRPLATVNVSVRDSVLGSLGNNAMNIGSETVGDFSDIRFRNISVTSAGQSGIGLVSMDGGAIRNVSYSSIRMTRTATPIYMFIGARQRRPPPRRVGSIAHVHFEDVSATDCWSDRHGAAPAPAHPHLPAPAHASLSCARLAPPGGRSRWRASRATPRAT